MRPIFYILVERFKFFFWDIIKDCYEASLNGGVGIADVGFGVFAAHPSTE